MDTAPKDGRRVLLLVAGSGGDQGAYAAWVDDAWRDEAGETITGQPLGWWPAPGDGEPQEPSLIG